MHKRILFVDDDVLNHWLMTEALNAMGFSVTGLCRGRDVVRILKEDDAFDLLLTDFETPDGISGFELAEHWRRVRPGRPVLYTSHSPCMAYGLLQRGEGFIRKHADTEDLLNAINLLLDEAQMMVHPETARRCFYIN